jgi:hypothetical protein
MTQRGNSAHEVPAQRSVCCGATIHAEDGGPDFSGDTTVTVNGIPQAGWTMFFVCDTCGEPCDLENCDD